jgi:hypothetical protein
MSRNWSVALGPHPMPIYTWVEFEDACTDQPFFPDREERKGWDPAIPPITVIDICFEFRRQ